MFDLGLVERSQLIILKAEEKKIGKTGSCSLKLKADSIWKAGISLPTLCMTVQKLGL